MGNETLEIMAKESSVWLRLLGLFIIWMFSLVFVCSVIDKSFVQIGFCLLIFFGFTAWGHLVVYPLFYKKRVLFEGFIWGSIAGIALGGFVTAIIVYLVGWNLTLILASTIALPTLLFLIVFKRWEKGMEPRINAKPDFELLLVALIVVTLFFYFPYKNLGALVGDKYVFAWLFGHDFINRVAATVSLSQGFPPEYFNFSGEVLSYYWLAYFYPALLFNIEWIKLDTSNILKAISLFYSLLTVAALVLFLGKLVKKRRHLFLLVCLALFFHSYRDIHFLVLKIWVAVTGETYLNIAGYDLFRFTGMSHTFYRFFLVQFQATLGMGIMLMIFSIYRPGLTLYGFFIIGLLIGLLFGVDATNGIMMGLWFGCAAGFYFLFNKRQRFSIARSHILAVACAVLVYVILFAIEMYSFKIGKGALQISPNRLSILFAPVYFPLEYGPMLFLAVAGIIKIIQQKESLDHWVYPYIILLPIGLFFAWFVINPADVLFGLLKATRVIPFGLLALTAYFCREGFRKRRTLVICIILLLPAVPVYFTDSFIASNISDPSATFVRQSDMEAAKWIRKNLPERAVIQAEHDYPGNEAPYKPRYYYSFIPAFAYRRTAIGEYRASSVAHSGTDQFGERLKGIKTMFSTNDVEECCSILMKYHIDYVYIGKLEKSLYPDGIGKFFHHHDYFENVYSAQGVDIFRFKRPD
ncbi:MAG TPA: hypothetical protein VMW42_13475 [Desulfatiglandales bacterium]|nr:hypothetical protein [Desulfatiglandales bacterium]